MARGKKKIEDAVVSPQGADKATQEMTVKGQSVDAKALEEKLAAQDKQIEALKEQTQSLIAALLGQQAKAGEKEDPLVKVTNVSGSTIVVPVINERGLKDEYIWHQRGDIREMPFSHAKYIKDKFPNMFSKGKLACPDIGGDSVNVIPDIAAFIEALDIDDIEARIAHIDSSATLWSIHNHIESLRFEDKAEMVNGELTLRQRRLPPKFALIHEAVRTKLYQMEDINLATHAG